MSVFMLYILFTIFCCGLTAYLVETHMVSVLKNIDEQNLELIEKLSDYISENRKQIQENIKITNQLTNKVFYNK